MSFLIIGDLHLTDRPRDAYRFGIFKWVREQQARYKPRATIFMGDLTDKKDKHPSVLVNRIIDEFYDLENFYVLMGNHDYVDPNAPFFRFLAPRFIYQPTHYKNIRTLFIPHCNDEADFARACKAFSNRHIDYVFCHQTFEGAIAETGVRLSGYKQAHIDYLRPLLGVYAGDVHRPQRAANVVYVGAPYHVRFGDDFEPRCLLVDETGTTKDLNLYYDTVRKWSLTVRDASEITGNTALFRGDQIKLTVQLAREEAVDWRTHKQQVLDAARKKGLEVFGIDLKINSATPRKVSIADATNSRPADVLEAFCNAENLPSQTRQAGKEICLRSPAST